MSVIRNYTVNEVSRLSRMKLPEAETSFLHLMKTQLEDKSETYFQIVVLNVFTILYQCQCFSIKDEKELEHTTNHIKEFANYKADQYVFLMDLKWNTNDYKECNEKTLAYLTERRK
jgi:hypothetical protein